MTANVDAMVREGIRAYRAGKKAEARTLLEKAAELDAYNEQAWMWLSAVVDTPEEQRICLENVLTINPNNQNATQGLQMLSGGTASAPPAAQSPKSASPFTTEDTPSSVEWEQPPTATSSPSSSSRPANEPSSQEYDSWVAGLGLGSSSSTSSSTMSSQSSALNNAEDIFGAGFFDDEEEADMDDFLSDVPKATPKPADDFLADSSFDDGPFSTAGLDLDDDLELPEPASKPTTTKLSPVEAAARRSPVERAAGGILVDDNFDTELNYEDDPSEFFQRIPKNIPPTRLPGTNERPNPVLLLTLVVLVILNFGAVAMLIGKFVG
jgi:hypothetical protein